jgi:hypothetical protein
LTSNDLLDVIAPQLHCCTHLIREAVALEDALDAGKRELCLNL